MKLLTERFATRLREVREAAGLTQAQLAKELNVSRGAISYYENGDRTPDIEFLDSVAMYFNLPFDFILGYTDNIKEEHKSMYEFYGLTDEACEELEFHSEIGHLLSFIFQHKNYRSLQITYKRLLENYKIFDYSQLGYISFLITDILNKIIRDSLSGLLHLQHTPEELEVMKTNTISSLKKLDELTREWDEREKQMKINGKVDEELFRQEHALQIASVEKVHEAFGDTVYLAEDIKEL